MNEIKSKDEDNTIRVKAFPSSKKEKFVHNKNGTFDIYIREPAQNNLANNRIREIVAIHFTVPKEQVIIHTGHRSRRKMLKIISKRI